MQQDFGYDMHKGFYRFVDEVYHIENDSLFQLNPAKYPTIPDYIIQPCNNHIALDTAWRHLYYGSGLLRCVYFEETIGRISISQ